MEKWTWNLRKTKTFSAKKENDDWEIWKQFDEDMKRWVHKG